MVASSADRSERSAPGPEGYLFFLSMGWRMFLNVCIAARRPWLRASVSANRKWMPSHTRASMTSFMTSENRVYTRGFGSDASNGTAGLIDQILNENGRSLPKYSCSIRNVAPVRLFAPDV